MNKGKCKCGNEYEYIGLDFGLCVPCIDKLEIEEEKPTPSEREMLEQEHMDKLREGYN